MKYAIIGCSAAGISAIEAIRSKDKSSEIAVISDEIRPLYSRCLISYLLAGTIEEKNIWYRNDSFFADNKVKPVLGVKAEKIDTGRKEIILSNKEKLKFDRLLIATGASPKLENIPGVEKKGVYPLRTIEHVSLITADLDKVKLVSVLGGGLIGLRAAYALKNRGKDVSVFVKSPHILSQIADSSAGSIMRKRMEERGIKIITGSSAKEITGDKSVKGIVLDNGSAVDCELVIIGKGVIPNIAIAKDAGIKTGWGITVDEFLRTSNKNIFSAGDVVESFDIATGEHAVNAIWPAACEQGRYAGLNMLGEENRYDGSLAMNSIEFFGLPVISMGVTKTKKDGCEEIIRAEVERNIYQKIVLKNNVIIGAVFVTAIDKAGLVNTLIKNKVDVSGIKDALLEDYFDYGKVIRFVKDATKGFKEPEFRETTMSL